MHLSPVCALGALLVLTSGCAAHQGSGLRLVPVSSPATECTDEAKAAGITGRAVFHCIVTQEGEVEGCIVKKPVPLMTERLREALEASRYQPILHDGKPVQVAYTFTLDITCK